MKEEPHAYKMISSSPSPKLKEFCLKDEEKFCMEKGTYKKRKYSEKIGLLKKVGKIFWGCGKA